MTKESDTTLIEKITPIPRGQDLTEADLRLIVQDLYDVRNWASLRAQLSVAEQKEQMARAIEVRLGRRAQSNSNPLPEQQTLRIDTFPFHCELLEQRPSEECGCPEEIWLMASLEVTIHFEQNGEGHIFASTGDWEGDKFVTCTDMVDLRNQAASWINTFPRED